MNQENLLNKIRQKDAKAFTHGGKFHADDIFSSALLLYLNPEIQITRGNQVPEEYDGIVFDIGRGAYDHHQKDSRVRENGIPYAAFGLLWEELGTEILGEELAEKFDVSRRTINRDIEDLCKAGIPIRTAQGTGGGISIMDGYRMDRTILTSKDMQMILAGLRSLDSVSGNRYYGQLMEKIQTGSSEFISERDSMLIDLSSWYKGSLVPKIEVIQNAIENRHTIQFKYYAPSGDSNRRIEPYYLVFRWSSWYVWGWSLEREDYRLFKLNRMDCVTESEQFFMCRNVPMPNLSNEKIFPGGIKVKVLFAPEVKWRLVEEFGPHCFTRTDDGRLLFSADYTDMENLVTWLMTFGAKAEVLEPKEARDIIRRNAEETLKSYGGLGK